MIEKVKETIEKYKLLKKGDRVIIALSGGPDSIFLLHCLLALKPTYDLKLHIAHLNHSLRKEADNDQQFVKNLASSINISCNTTKVDVKLYARENKLGIEDASRRVRYSFLKDLANSLGMNKIATGHTANDQVETLILRIARGTGLEGLALIKPKTNNIIRPLIEIKREDIIESLEQNSIDYCIDASNYEPEYMRNFVRANIIPLLLELNPNVIEQVVNTREILEKEDSFLEEQTKKFFRKTVKEQNTHKIILDLSKFLSYDISIKRRMIRKAIELLKGDKKRITFCHVKDALSLIEKGRTGSSIDIPSLRIKKNRNGICIEKKNF